MSEGYEYNLLTQELLLQGYTAEHYPDYVRIGNGRRDFLANRLKLCNRSGLRQMSIRMRLSS